MASLQVDSVGLATALSPVGAGHFKFYHTTFIVGLGLSLDTFCLKSFDATDAAFRMGGVLYNLLAEFRETVLPRSWFERRLRAVRDLVFLVGADLISQGRRVQIRFAMPEPDRPEFLRRLRMISSKGLPIAAQLEWSLSDQTPTHPDKIITPIPLITPLSTANQSP